MHTPVSEIWHRRDERGQRPRLRAGRKVVFQRRVNKANMTSVLSKKGRWGYWLTT